MILVTGGAGFIGGNFVKQLSEQGKKVIVVDNLTYASNYDYIKDCKCHFYKMDIADELLEKVFEFHEIDTVVNFAAESHVDNSIDDCMPFVWSNIVGTVNLLNLSKKYKVNKFLQISTDEVFGSINEGQFTENSMISPNNPYSASKASAEHFVNAYANTYKMNTMIVNCSNNYGPNQYYEKLIPLTISKIKNGENIPVYGDGQQIRDWLYVEDACEAFQLVLEKGKSGERYCIGGDNEITNLKLVETLLQKMNASTNLVKFVTDRPGHDIRYSTDITKIKELGWKPKTNFYEGLDKTIEWYKK